MKLKLTQFSRKPETVMAAKITKDMIDEKGLFVLEHNGMENVYSHMDGAEGCWAVIDNGRVRILTDKTFMEEFVG